MNEKRTPTLSVLSKHAGIIASFLWPLLFSEVTVSAQTSGYVSTNGVRLYYEIHGQGEPLVLIEGLGVATWIWEQHLPSFAGHFKTIAYDNRGSGKSDKPAGPYTISMMADDLAGLLDSLNIECAHVLGISLGGFIAQDFAVRYPSRVRKLILVATSAGGPDHVPMTQEVLAAMFATGPDLREVTRRKLALAFTEDFMQNRTGDVEHLIDLRLQHPTPPEAYLAQAAAGANFNLSEEVKSIHAPVLILAGSADRIVPVQNAHNLAKKIEGSTLKIYEGLGHQFFVENPRPFIRDVIDFLQK